MRKGKIRGRKRLPRNEGRLIMFVDHRTSDRNALLIPPRPDEEIIIQTEMIYGRQPRHFLIFMLISASNVSLICLIITI